MNRRILIGCLLFWFLEVFSVRPHHEFVNLKKEETQLVGAIHVHSTFSDGGGNPQEIAAQAKESGLDFVIVTDHNNSRSRMDFEKNYDGLDLFVEMEASTPAGHAIALYSDTSARTYSDSRITDLSYEHFIGQPSPKDFFIIAAHPSNVKNPWTQLDRYPDGLEVANFDSFWQRQASDTFWGFALTMAVYPFSNYLGALRFFQFYDKDLSSWDSINNISPGHVGILGHDTHSKTKLSNALVFRWPDYGPTFRLASNVIFLDEPKVASFEARKHQIYNAIRKGRVAIAFHLLHPFEGNHWTLNCGSNQFLSGDTVDMKQNCHFQAVTPIHFPYPVVLRLFQDGKLLHETVSEENVKRIPLSGRGVYRLEVYARVRSLFHFLLNRDVPYVVYNPIYVR